MQQKTRFEELLTLQDELNTLTAGGDWKSGVTNKCRKIDWYKQIMMESCELLDSFNHKHWKDINAPHDIANAKVEAVDILHFVLSQQLVDSCKLHPLSQKIEFTSGLSCNISAIENSTRCIINVCSSHMPVLTPIIEDFNAVISRLFESEDEVIKLYLGKAVLNTHRVLNNYSDGDYIKIWFGEEDNVWMQRFLKQTTDKEELLKLLKNKYIEVLNNEKIQH